MKRWLLCLIILALLVPGVSACGGGNAENTQNAPGTPAIARVRIWITLSNDPDAPPVTILTPEQTVQASIWARGTTENTITFKVNLNYGEKFTTLVTGVRTEGSSKSVSVGALSTPLETGKYTFQAISGAFGEIVGSLEITVVSSLPPGTSATTSPQISQTPAVTSTLSEQPDMATYRKYFTELGLGKMPAEVKNPPTNLQRNVSIFTAGDQICLYGTIILECQVRSSVYDVSARKEIKGGGLPKPMTGGFAAWEPVDLPVGKYEYKIYVGDALVAVFPFEVR
jgi:hypothetical protein